MFWHVKLTQAVRQASIDFLALKSWSKSFAETFENVLVITQVQHSCVIGKNKRINCLALWPSGLKRQMQNDDACSGYFTKSSSNWMLGTQACVTTTQRMDVKSLKKHLSAASTVCARVFFDFNTLRQKFESCPMQPAVLLSPLQID